MRPITVLAVDDETGFTEILSKRLGRIGFQVFTADSGRRALALLEEVEIDVVLLDVNMPEMDGVRTLGEIKQRNPHVEIVMLTGRGDADIVISSLGMGAFDYLKKPVAFETLAEKLNSAAARKRQREENSRNTQRK